MDQLTVDALEKIAPDTIFAKGTGFVRHPWFSKSCYEKKQGAYKFVSPTGMTKVKWVAVRGGIADWAIYHSLDANLEQSDYLDGNVHLNASFEQIYREGAKLHDRDIIQELVPCTKEALNCYRD